MAVVNETKRAENPFRFNWILDKQNDLIWYIGSALVGYLYFGLIWLFGRNLNDPIKDVFATLNLGGIQINITLQLLVLFSFTYVLDSPHIFATLARTFFDPDERQVRRTELTRSWLWFVFGPAFIVVPYVIGAILAPMGIQLSDFWLNFGWLIYFVVFRLWAYYHVVRQHWGFFSLYKRRNNDFGDERVNKVDAWFFNLSLYLPLLMFMTSAFYSKTTGYPNLGLGEPLFPAQNAGWYGEASISTFLYPLTATLYAATLLGYVAWNIFLWRSGRPLNGPKLLLMALLVPLHFLAFSSPLSVLFLVPLITVGHNIQYHRIVWSYGKNKYSDEKRAGFEAARKLFSQVWVYALFGVLFTFALYDGPWIHLVKATTGFTLDQSLLNSLSMMAGVLDPSKLNLGEKIFAAVLSGWAMQHYYLDSKIWRVRKDKMVQQNLKVE